MFLEHDDLTSIRTKPSTAQQGSGRQLVNPSVLLSKSVSVIDDSRNSRRHFKRKNARFFITRNDFDRKNTSFLDSRHHFMRKNTRFLINRSDFDRKFASFRALQV